MTISKIEVARRQTDSAIRLLFDEFDMLPIITIVHAADEILSSLTSRHPRSVRAILLSLVKPGKAHEKAFWDIHNKLPNFLKHASSNPAEAIDVPKDTYADSILATCCVSYRDLTGCNTTTMEAYLRWYGLLNPTHVDSGSSLRKTSDGGTAAMFRKMSRGEQLRFGLDLLRRMEAAAR
jgi:hypothetical protein